MRRAPSDPLGLHSIAPAQQFAANGRLHRPIAPEPIADDLADAMVRRHCAGMQGRLGGAEVLAALNAPPDLGGRATPTIRWLLGSATVPDLHCLAWRCGVPITMLAAHAQVLGMTHRKLVRWLNQFAAPE